MSDVSPKIAAAKVMSLNVMEGGAVMRMEDSSMSRMMSSVLAVGAGREF